MKKVMSLAVVAALGLGFNGCSNKLPSLYSDKEFNVPNLNKISTVEVGENLYEKLGNVGYKIKLSQPTKELNSKDYNPWWLLLGPYGAGIMLLSADDNNLSKNPYLRTWNGNNTVCNVESDCLIDISNNNEFTHTSNYPNNEFNKLEKPIKYTKHITVLPNTQDAFKYVALYQGKVGKKVKISYREFYNDMARPSFTQNIDYELNDKKPTIIGFKGLRIKIIKATNMDITYKVIKDYK